MSSIVVLSDRRWDAVARRPQHIFPRLAATGDRVLYVEPPVRDPDGPWAERWRPLPDIEVLRPHVPPRVAAPAAPVEIAGRTAGFHETDLPSVRAMLVDALAGFAHTELIAWVETPSALPLLDAMPDAIVVYDCVRDLAAAPLDAGTALHAEAALLDRADVVFTANPALRAMHANAHENVHCIPPAVEAQHFQPGAPEHTHPAQRAIPEPRLGWFGTIDEAVDLALVAALADERPDWQIVMIGPVTVPESTLPRRPNLHWLGPQRYADLPRFCTRWDVCLLPMRTDGTDGPTRTVPGALLEYMAAERPIVATPFAGLPKICRDVVFTGRHAAELAAAALAAMRESVEARDARVAHMRAIVSANGWEIAAARIRSILRAAPRHAHVERLARSAGATQREHGTRTPATTGA